MATTIEDKATVENKNASETSRPGAKANQAMKISCDREQLLQAFQTVATVAPARSPKPILQNVKLEATEGGAMLSATDLEIGIRHFVSGVDVQLAGSVVLSVKRFGDILRESSDQTVHIEADAQGAVIRGERSQFRLTAEDPAWLLNAVAELRNRLGEAREDER